MYECARVTTSTTTNSFSTSINAMTLKSGDLDALGRAELDNKLDYVLQFVGAHQGIPSERTELTFDSNPRSALRDRYDVTDGIRRSSRKERKRRGRNRSRSRAVSDSGGGETRSSRSSSRSTSQSLRKKTSQRDTTRERGRSRGREKENMRLQYARRQSRSRSPKDHRYRHRDRRARSRSIESQDRHHHRKERSIERYMRQEKAVPEVFASSDSSVLVARPKRPPMPPPSPPKPCLRQADPPSSSLSSENSSSNTRSDSPAPVVINEPKFEKRSRHKMYEDREMKKTVVTEKAKAVRDEKVKERKSSKSKGKPEVGKSLVMDKFKSSLVIRSDRLTLKPSHSLGIFRKGKASPAVPKQSQGVGDLSFSDMEFLTGMKRVHPSQYTPPHLKKKEKTGPLTISTYFDSSKKGPAKSKIMDEEREQAMQVKEGERRSAKDIERHHEEQKSAPQKQHADKCRKTSSMPSTEETHEELVEASGTATRLAADTSDQPYTWEPTPEPETTEKTSKKGRPTAMPAESRDEITLDASTLKHFAGGADVTITQKRAEKVLPAPTQEARRQQSSTAVSSELSDRHELIKTEVPKKRNEQASLTQQTPLCEPAICEYVGTPNMHIERSPLSALIAACANAVGENFAVGKVSLTKPVARQPRESEHIARLSRTIESSENPLQRNSEIQNNGVRHKSDQALYHEIEDVLTASQQAALLRELHADGGEELAEPSQPFDDKTHATAEPMQCRPENEYLHRYPDVAGEVESVFVTQVPASHALQHQSYPRTGADRQYPTTCRFEEQCYQGHADYFDGDTGEEGFLGISAHHEVDQYHHENDYRHQEDKHDYGMHAPTHAIGHDFYRDQPQHAERAMADSDKYLEADTSLSIKRLEREAFGEACERSQQDCYENTGYAYAEEPVNYVDRRGAVWNGNHLDGETFWRPHRRF
ncbi:hypothetical protein SAICODRAFT_133033 [Saitoella complicata NRRL Y-17804]|uniref:Uncharacterized protein n=1 Tax=Saitoella complicata (strain BCRC 22490 / CBS 7301 / JCM 7358 / NBRC 10748 / NRRL Y-17804) TaxID=698492 RepID=A0A0E9NNR5_SAICN|nr:uncharacterized protein SAICODRAFT_133033 [Saitoella complicata NRRL Y-17804]ODQ52297.1 hypothetical protein SAICODRAFT_133033 [Saitoella complicata NRRL Y-17804]GAO51438.1 hypothetical protein G7K_5539-t1 [Saitoella complicata NRRL Y-17804]